MINTSQQKAPELDMRRRRTTVAKDEHDPDK